MGVSAKDQGGLKGKRYRKKLIGCAENCIRMVYLQKNIRQHRTIPALQLKHRYYGCEAQSALPKMLDNTQKVLSRFLLSSLYFSLAASALRIMRCCHKFQFVILILYNQKSRTVWPVQPTVLDFYFNCGFSYYSVSAKLCSAGALGRSSRRPHPGSILRCRSAFPPSGSCGWGKLRATMQHRRIFFLAEPAALSGPTVDGPHDATAHTVGPRRQRSGLPRQGPRPYRGTGQVFRPPIRR